VGVTIAVPFLHYGLAFFSLIRHFNTNSYLSVAEITAFVLSYAVQYAWGIAYLFITFNDEQRDVKGFQSSTAGLYIVAYLIVLPFITSFSSTILKWRDDKGKVSKMLFVLLALTVAQGVAMVVCAYIYLTYVQGIAVTLFIVFVLYIVFQVYIYKKND